MLPDAGCENQQVQPVLICGQLLSRQMRGIQKCLHRGLAVTILPEMSPCQIVQPVNSTPIILNRAMSHLMASAR
jgi:hypothetical protein